MIFKNLFKTWIPAFAGMTVVVSVFAAPPSVPPAAEIQFHPPKPERRVLSNGVVVYLLEDHELPQVSVELKMKMSPADEPDSQKGTVGFMGEVWRTGGTASKTPEKLNDELEYIAATVETDAGEESAGVSLSCLSKDLNQGLNLFADVLLHPEFRADQFSLAKVKTLDALRRKNDTPNSIGRRVIRDVLYGKDHYYARELTPEIINRINRNQLIDLYKKVVTPDTAIMAISGDFDKEKMVVSLEERFQNWKPSGRKIIPFDYAIRNPEPGKIVYVEKDFNQSRIFIGRVGVTRLDPDEYALEVANYILGGGGPSRLFGEIRSRLGLAYLVGSFFSQQKGPGLLGAVCQTKAKSTVAAIQAINKELDKFVSALPTDDEKSIATDSLVNSFVFRFESPKSLVNQAADLEFYGFPKDYLESYVSKIKLVKKEDVLRVAKKYFSRDQMKIILVGDKKKFDADLQSLGNVVVIPLDKID